MLSISFYTKSNSTISIRTSELCFEYLANLGFSKNIPYETKEFTIEDEKYELSVAELNLITRSELTKIVEKIRHRELICMLNNLDDTPTIKEIREQIDDIRSLTNIYQAITDENNIYVGFE